MLLLPAKVAFVVLLASTVWFGVRVISEMNAIVDEHVNAPSMDLCASRYHSTLEMYATMRKDNDIVAFSYTWYDLTPNKENETEKLYGYGPVDVAENFDVRLFIVCNQHGRELVSGELCYSMIRFIQHYAQDDELTPMFDRLQIENVGFWIVPVANPWARLQVEGNETMVCRRTNANNVDLNRNYPSLAQRTQGVDEEYPGRAAFSEYEAVAVDQFLDFANASVVLNIHSGGRDVLLPYDGRVQEHKYYVLMKELAERARAGSALDDLGRVRVGMSSLLYGVEGVQGSFTDYAMDTASTDLAYTLEVFADERVLNVANMTDDECSAFYNPATGEELVRVQRYWIRFILRLCEELLDVIV